MANQLVPGTISKVYNQELTQQNFYAQAIEVKRLGSSSGNAQERYRLSISDGQNFCHAMLATQINNLVNIDGPGQLTKNSIIHIKEHICNMMQGKKLVIALNLEVVGQHHEVLGNPQPMEAGQAKPAGGPAAYNIQQQPGNQNQGGWGGQQQQGGYVKSEPNRQQYGGGGQQMGGYNQNGGGYNNNNNNNNMGGGNNNSGFNQGGGGGGYGNGSMNNGGGGGFGQGGGGGGYQQNSGGFDQNSRGMGGGMGGGGGGMGGGNMGGGGGFNQQGGGRSSGILHTDNNAGGPATPIASITPYVGKWTIQGRLVVKGTMRFYKNQRGEGRLFSIDLMDSSGDIRGTFFNDDADKWIEFLEVNKVYRVQGGNVKPANKTFNQTKSEWEITFGRDTTFEPLDERAAPKVTYQFVKIDQVEQLDTGAIVDIMGIVQHADPLSEVTIKSGANAGNKISKRDVTIVDQSGKSIRLTLWDEAKDKVSENDNSAPVIAVKNCKVGDFQGKNVSTTRSSMVQVNPDMQEAHGLRGWYDFQGKNAAFTSVGGGGGGSMRDPRKTVSQIKEENLGHGDKPDYFTLRGWVSFIKRDGTWQYPANPSTKKKVIENGDQWLDESTGEMMAQCERRYILGAVASDHTGSSWVSAFNEPGIKIMGGKTADEIWEVQQAEGEGAFNGIFQENNFKPYVFKLRAKTEKWQDEDRVKVVVQEVSPMNFKEGSAELTNLIRAYIGNF